MPSPSPANLRAFVRRHTSLQPVPGVPGLRLQLGSDVMELLQLAGRELGQSDPPLPFWGFAWAGGLAVARYLIDNPTEVAGRRVVDLASGSGLCAIVAMRQGAAAAHGFDVDPLAEAAAALNARANGVHIAFSCTDPLDEPPPDCDVVLAGDVCYEERMAGRMMDWLRGAARAGVRVLVGDPGRRYLPVDLDLLATYSVQTSRELEDSDVKPSSVYTLRA